MEFNDNKPIYRQIVDYAFNRILDKSWEAGEILPSVRELTAELGVNTRTIMKAFETLQDLEIAVPKRGIGYQLAVDGREKVIKERRREFFENVMPTFVNEMQMLQIPWEEVIEFINRSGKKD